MQWYQDIPPLTVDRSWKTRSAQQMDRGPGLGLHYLKYQSGASSQSETSTAQLPSFLDSAIRKVRENKRETYGGED